MQRPRCPIWIAGVTPNTAGPRRVARHGVEGLALVGGGVWTPQHVIDALAAGGLDAGTVDVALVGDTHDDPAALASAGATWCIPEIGPGATAAEALRLAATTP